MGLFYKNTFLENDKTDEKMSLVFSQGRHRLAFVQQRVCSQFIEFDVAAAVGRAELKRQCLCACAHGSGWPPFLSLILALWPQRSSPGLLS